jgi:hypothetical protein
MKKRKPPKPAKPRRNPYARALGGALFKPKVVKRKDEYQRKPRHRKRGAIENGEGER